MSGDGTFAWRAIGPRDAANWAGLLAAISATDRDWEYFSEQDLLEDFSDPDMNFPRGSVAVYHQRTMAGFGALAARSAAEPVHDMRYQGGVHPAYRGRGLGGQLLDWAETAAIPLHQERYPGRPLSLSGSCLSHNAGAIALYAAHGYLPSRWFHGMARDLSAEVPAASVPAGVEVVGVTPERWEDARLIRNEAFRDHWGSTETTVAAWAHYMQAGAFRPALSFLAYAGTEPLSLVIGHEYEAYAAATGRREFYIALVGTRRAGRGRGIASALLLRALAGARAAGFTFASLGVDADSPTGALGLYQRAGFTVEITTVTQTKPLLAGTAGPAPGPGGGAQPEGTPRGGH
jgi:mycothiol synthase